MKKQGYPLSLPNSKNRTKFESYDESLPIVAWSTCVNATSENRVVVFGTIK